LDKWASIDTPLASGISHDARDAKGRRNTDPTLAGDCSFWNYFAPACINGQKGDNNENKPRPGLHVTVETSGSEPIPFYVKALDPRAAKRRAAWYAGVKPDQVIKVVADYSTEIDIGSDGAHLAARTSG
jgi:hypothetical protein